nr:cytochrome c oxidase subunit III [Stylonema alsidii]
MTSFSLTSSSYQPYHLVSPSPWPFLTSASLLPTALSFIAYLHGLQLPALVLFLPLLSTTLIVTLWLKDILRESILEGSHGTSSLYSQRTGILLFIASEVALFSSFFWAYLTSCLAPTTSIGCIWPPHGISPILPTGLPLLNTLLLLTSGFSLTIAHHRLVSASASLTQPINSLILTILFAIAFTLIQLLEYTAASYTIASGAYGSTFYLLTGLHGLHVLAGTIYLALSLQRLLSNSFTLQKHLQFECSAWYWHAPSS